jgi:hypothetical protein
MCMLLHLLCLQHGDGFRMPVQPHIKKNPINATYVGKHILFIVPYGDINVMNVVNLVRFCVLSVIIELSRK